MADKARHSSVATVIAKDALLEGKLTVRGALRVEGAVLGTLCSTGATCVAESGRVLGEVRAAALEIAGRVDGIVLASDTLRMGPQGYVQGHARFRTLIVERGGSIEGSTYQSGEPLPDDEDE